MLLVAHDERELDLRARDREVHALAVVVDAEDVRALLGDEREEVGEVARAGRRPACARRGSGPRA